MSEFHRSWLYRELNKFHMQEIGYQWVLLSSSLASKTA